ncbi:MAG: type II secretion system protein GspM [Pseudomonadota bacterium]
MKEWYLRQTPRDQKIVLALAALVVIVMVYALLIHPLATGLGDRRVSVAAKHETLQWMLESAAKVKSQGGGSSVRKNSNQAAYVLLDQEIRKAGISGAATRVEPAGKDKKGARVQFSEVDFDKLVRVLGSLQAQHGLSVTNANVSRRDGGVVSARVTVEGG